MLIKFKFVLVLMGILLAGSCSDNDKDFPTTTAELQVKVNDTLLIASRDTAPVEGGRDVSVEPKHGKVFIDAFTIKYLADTGYMGEDFIEITNKGSIGDGNYFTTSVEQYSLKISE
ncbi:hypothetical protein [Leeuwenhoekiella sp. NPDC079379]|uniref:hypothetical protein n=1 Tax=Leeuwenhoekiella sp. NPDC079379 TaxID=3364122 RepID=UPI0037C5B418